MTRVARHAGSRALSTASIVVALTTLCAFGFVERSPFELAIERGNQELAEGHFDVARLQMERALERDPKSAEAWYLRERLAAATGDEDDRLWSLHRRFALRMAQKAPRAELDGLRKEIEAVDPIAADLLGLRTAYVDRLAPIADSYEKEKRPHAAIRVHQQILAIDPERDASKEAIERISSRPDPSLAETAKAKDLFEGVSEEWMHQFDAEHASWDKQGVLERTNYVTKTDAGYAVMVRAAEAMEQMNAFYREFFHYGTDEDKHAVPRIELHVFKNRDEYLTLGQGPPAKWSGGQFTGAAVETYVGEGGFEETTTTLFHEAAHQFVSLATRAVGWLNEGLASFFEGSRILANGTVQTNLPANHRLFPLAERMEAGWMQSADDGIDPSNSNAEPRTAPTFRIVLENKYQWGPPWYAPTWGVVYFLYNFQDPTDGRFVYRSAFREFIDKSGGRSGEGAVENFEKVVLGAPQPPTKGVDFGKADEPLELVKDVGALDVVWKKWIVRLRDEQGGKLASDRPYLQWARHAITRKDLDVAKEHFEKGVLAEPENVELLQEFAKFLSTSKSKNVDRAAKLALKAVQVLERTDKVDAKKLGEAERLLESLDPKRGMLDRLLKQLEASATGVARRYLAAGRPMMAMEVSYKLGTDLRMPSLFAVFEEAARTSGRSLALWKLAYDEKDFKGWIDAGNNAFVAKGAEIESKFGDVRSKKYDYQFLMYDTITSGDFSFETELLANDDELAFAGLVFGKKASSNFHTLFYFPGRKADPAYNIEARQSAVDLTSFYGNSDFKIWRHNVLPVATRGWHKLRLDVVGTSVDVWCDGELVVSQEFPSLDVLRGGFGLITGPGSASWRNVRYLARNANDPGAAIERELTMKRLREEALRSGKPIGSSYVGLAPPFPTSVQWVKEPRASFDEAGAVPQLLLFFSQQQNDKLPLDGWAKEFAAAHADVGLKCLCVASPDDKQLDDYLKQHDFPGSVGHDTRPPSGKSYGLAFERYFIARFNLPRALLLDVDQCVVWEGDPGFSFDTPWKPGQPSYLDAPMQELIAKRHLKELAAWKQQWQTSGKAAFQRGDLASAAPLLLQAESMKGALEPAVVDVQKKLVLLRAALTGVDTTMQQLSRVQGEAALLALLHWAELLGQPAPDEVKHTVKKALDAPHAKSFVELCVRGHKLAKTVLGKEGVESVKPFVAELKTASSATPPTDAAPKPTSSSNATASPSPNSASFSALYASMLESLVASGAAADVAKLLESAELAVPERWLASTFFGW